MMTQNEERYLFAITRLLALIATKDKAEAEKAVKWAFNCEGEVVTDQDSAMDNLMDIQCDG